MSEFASMPDPFKKNAAEIASSSRRSSPPHHARKRPPVVKGTIGGMVVVRPPPPPAAHPSFPSVHHDVGTRNNANRGVRVSSSSSSQRTTKTNASA